MSTKEIRLDLEATLTQAVYGHGHAHYGYWPDGVPQVLSLQSLGQAQQAYFDLLVSRIPKGTRTILDVGSGTGANALGLTEKGYALECLCPSEHLNALARGKLRGDVLVHDLKFEDYDTERTFDLCMFAESFHYIDLAQALAKLARHADRHVLIFDYFRKDAAEAEGGTRGTHAEFRRMVEDQGVFEVLGDEDLTQAILPTFVVLDHMRTNLFGPFAQRARAALGKAYPIRAKLAEWLLGRKLDKIGRPGGRAKSFPERLEYRLILMRRI